MKPILIDKLVKSSYGTQCGIDGKWYIAKPLLAKGKLKTFIDGIKGLKYLVTGKAFLVQYKEDQ